MEGSIFSMGMQVEGYYGDGWYRCTISAVNKNGTFALSFDDGDYIPDATLDEIRHVEGPETEDQEGLLDFPTSEVLENFDNELLHEDAKPIPNILGNVESFLLPSASLKSNDSHSMPGPMKRLEDLLLQVAVFEHIRSLQTMYRDEEDEYNLAAELRPAHANAKFPTKLLMEKISDARSRVVALSKLSFGDDSLELLKAEVDLAASYALRGLWPHVVERVNSVMYKLQQLGNGSGVNGDRQDSETMHSEAILLSRHIGCVFESLRSHIKDNFGQVSISIVNELDISLRQISGSVSGGSNDGSDGGGFHEESIELLHSLEEYLLSYREKALATAVPMIGEQKPRDVRDSDGFRFAPPAAMLYYSTTASWGDVINFLRDHCRVMKVWMEKMKNYVLPQNRAILQMVFHSCDRQKKGICHPQLLSNSFAKFPSVSKILSGTGIVKACGKFRLEVDLFINPVTGKILDISNGKEAIYAMCNNQTAARVSYELPITWEEVLILYTREVPPNTRALLKVQALSLLGTAQIFQNNLLEAESNMIEALHTLEFIGMDMEIVACELYNSIAQMMITKYRQWQTERKKRCKTEAESWIRTNKGMKELANELRSVIKHCKDNGIENMSVDEMESKAVTFVLKQRQSYLMAKSAHGGSPAGRQSVIISSPMSPIGSPEGAGATAVADPTAHSVEAAFRYLVRSLEIIEEVHGSHHPTVGTACLAIASVKNLCGSYDESREWLMRCLRIFEKVDPVPIRAIAFVQTQLSGVLAKQGHKEEAAGVLSQAVGFYTDRAKESILKRTTLTPAGPQLSEPFCNGQFAFTDIQQALDLTTKVVTLSTSANCNDNARWCAIDKVHNMAEMAESAFGWDSTEAAQYRKDVGQRCASIGDWGRAFDNYSKCLEAYGVIYTETDKKYVHMKGLVQNAMKMRKASYG